MKHRLRLRRLTALVIAAVLATMSLVLVGPASASGATTPVSSASPSAASQPVASPPAASQHAGGGSHTDAGSSHQYKPAGCNSPSEARTEDGVAYVRCFAMGLADDNGKLLRFVDGPPSSALTPEDLQRAYNLPDAGSGMTVAIVDPFGYNAAESDLAVYRSEYGLPPCTTDNGCFTKIDQYGGTSYPPQNAKWSVEAALDLDAVSAACPKCHILLVQADDNSTLNLGKAVDTAVAMGADVVSNSYGNYDGFPSEQQFDHFYDHPGVAITVSTGDIGNVVSWPSTAGTVTAVGGTSLHADDSERGWSESAWDEGGSGCSHYEPRPSYQEGVETTCGDFGATADISVVGDPATGLAVYNTLGHSGWSQTGGTSLSSPLAAGMYALAGEATPGTYPVTYPYLAAPEHLNDITAGANNSCGTKLCEAGPGWDGPTGLGTPDGVQALTQGETGEVVGTVTSGGEPLPGVTITATDPDGNEFTATSGDDGGYDLYAPVGTYDVTATKYAYEEGTVTDVVVAVDDEVTTDFTLTALPSETVSGRVTDGSGHGWPMRAKITIDGYPYGAIYSDPYTGHYSVDLPVGSTYQMHAEPVDMAGYQPTDVSVDLTGDGAGAERDVEIALKVDTSACVAPGYAFNDVGTTETFTGWDGTTAEDGWTVTDNIGNGQTWQFDNPGGWDGPPGGDGDFAVADSYTYGDGGSQDTSLVSPVLDLSDQTDPQLLADTRYVWFPDETATVDLSVDGGATWSTVQQLDRGTGHNLKISLPAAAGQPDVRVRFHFIGSDSRRWGLDNVFVGTRTCAPVPGGVVAGIVTDANTGDTVDGAKVARDAHQSEAGVSSPTPADTGVSDGYYWLFSSHTGQTDLTTTRKLYATTHSHADVVADGVQHQDLELRAGHLTVDKQGVSVSEVLGAAKSRTVTFGNDGTAPVHVTLGTADAGFTPMGKTAAPSASGAPKQVVKTRTSSADMPARAKHGARSARSAQKPLRQASPASEPWVDIANYPTGVMDNAVASHDGKVYVVGGNAGGYKIGSANVYDPTTRSWSAIAPLPERVSAASAQFVGDTLYVVGGWNGSSHSSARTYAYDPSADDWTRVADMPVGLAASGSAVVGKTLYVIGGCTSGNCSAPSDAVYAYQPGRDSWSQQPDYPMPVAFTACGGVVWKVVCAGGTNDGSLTATYAYTPGADGWNQKADLPVDAWGASSASANGRLEVMGGAIDDGSAVTNQGFAYDPSSDAWTALPNSNNAVYRGGAACGIYKVGGSLGGFHTVPFSESLPGYGQCGGDVSWLSTNKTEFDVAPGQSVSVRVTMDSSGFSQPGDYRAKLVMDAVSPYSAEPVDVTMHVNPPRRWGKIAGTVTNDAGDAVSGATVAICTMYNARTGRCGPVTYTLKTDIDGAYQMWMNKGFNPLQVIAAKPGYIPRMRIARLHKGETTQVDFTLTEAGYFTQRKAQTFLHNHMHVR